MLYLRESRGKNLLLENVPIKCNTLYMYFLPLTLPISNQFLYFFSAIPKLVT